jgi:hypothetical protein
MAINFLWPIIVLNTKTGGNTSATTCLWKALRDSLF